MSWVAQPFDLRLGRRSTRCQVPAVWAAPPHQQSKQLDLLLMSAKPVTDGRAHQIVSGRRSTRWNRRRSSHRPSAELIRRAAHACTGPAMPLRSLVPRSFNSNRSPKGLRVPSAITTMFGSAIACSRAARLGVSPTIALLLRFTRSDKVANDYQPCCNAGTGLQRPPVSSGRSLPTDQLQSCAVYQLALRRLRAPPGSRSK